MKRIFSLAAILCGVLLVTSIADAKSRSRTKDRSYNSKKTRSVSKVSPLSRVVLSIEELKLLKPKHRRKYLKRLGKYLVKLEKEAKQALRQKQNKRRRSYSFNMSLVDWLVQEANASTEFRCIGGGVPVAASANRCGVSEYAGFSCPAGKEICNPFVFGVQKSNGQPFCFNNATTVTCYRRSNTNPSGGNATFDGVFENTASITAYNEFRSTMERICKSGGHSIVGESARAVGSACHKIIRQTDINRRRGLYTFQREGDELRRTSVQAETDGQQRHRVTPPAGSNCYWMRQKQGGRFVRPSDDEDCLFGSVNGTPTIVTQTGPAEGNWIPIQTTDGRTGYMYKNGLRETNETALNSVNVTPHTPIDLGDHKLLDLSKFPEGPLREFARKYNHMLQNMPASGSVSCANPKSSSWTEGQCLVCNCQNEAGVRSEYGEGQVAVNLVALNRTIASTKPSSFYTSRYRHSNVCSTVLAPSQFSWTIKRSGRYPYMSASTVSGSNYRRCYQSSLESLRRAATNNNRYGLYYHADYIALSRTMRRLRDRGQCGTPLDLAKIPGSRHRFFNCQMNLIPRLAGGQQIQLEQ